MLKHVRVYPTHEVGATPLPPMMNGIAPGPQNKPLRNAVKEAPPASMMRVASTPPYDSSGAAGLDGLIDSGSVPNSHIVPEEVLGTLTGELELGV